MQQVELKVEPRKQQKRVQLCWQILNVCNGVPFHEIARTFFKLNWSKAEKQEHTKIWDSSVPALALEAFPFLWSWLYQT